jgi:hypothetical protein
MNNINDTFIIKINMNDINNNNLNNFVNDYISEKFEYSDKDEIIYMNKKDYNKYILNTYGTILIKTKINDNCTICFEKLKYTNKLYKLYKCSHIFHYKCINKWFTTISNNNNNIHNCPLCRSSNEIIL